MSLKDFCLGERHLVHVRIVHERLDDSLRIVFVIIILVLITIALLLAHASKPKHVVLVRLNRLILHKLRPLF